MFNDIGSTLDAGRNGLLLFLIYLVPLALWMTKSSLSVWKVLSCINSYLSYLTEAISINGTHSNPQPVKIGVPQGSTLSPILFSLYIPPIKDSACLCSFYPIIC
ncbi:RNA-directed DNA polymerase from mobile element jockey-like [Oopsacas minuta]|uniref:RNA-directed DNA polymerase from mobile element jockey-like n=1 Tax=Oopsacas minuta TaxID=111878 RepID=A0AAV7JIG5_9METZ|nr:RNA-directed DNA polymerase from mobile element jockey-like [Oopsacas minuta]